MEGNGLDRNERDNDRSVRLDKDTQINVIVNSVAQIFKLIFTFGYCVTQYTCI